MNLYTVLGVSTKATPEEIRKVYLKLAKKYHPDKNIEGAEKFKEIGNAYKTLSCPTSRSQYDLTIRVSSRKSKTTSAESSQNFFKKQRAKRPRSPPPSPPRPSKKATSPPLRPKPPTPPPPPPPPPPPKRSDYDIKTSTYITLADSFIGLPQHRVTFMENIDCTICRGRDGPRVPCGLCFGTGRRTTGPSKNQILIVCDGCNGTGKTGFNMNCIGCHGRKQVEREFYIPISKGIHSHHILKVKNRGNLMPDNITRGDVIIQVFVADISEDGLFQRQGDNLHVTLNVNLRDAILGFGSKPLFKHLDNRPMHMHQLPGAVIKPNDKYTIKGEGMPLFMDPENAKGDIHVTFKVLFPDYVNIPTSPEHRKVLNDIFETEEERKAKENAIVIDDDDEEQNKSVPEDTFNIPESNSQYEIVDSDEESL